MATSAEHAAGCGIDIDYGKGLKRFDLIRAKDVAEFTRRRHDAHLKAVQDCIDKIADSPKERVKILISASAGNSFEVIEELSSWEGVAFIVKRCYERGGNVGDPNDEMSPQQMMGVFNELMRSSGLVDPLAKTGAKEEIQTGENSGQT